MEVKIYILKLISCMNDDAIKIKRQWALFYINIVFLLAKRCIVKDGVRLMS